MRVTHRPFRIAAAAALALALPGCISFGGEPPASLLTLSPAASAPAGPGIAANAARPVIAVLAFDTPAKLDVLRVPVAVSETELAYLQEAFWVEKPARLFRRLVGETIRARGAAMVIDGDETATLATVSVQGTLIDMGYDAPSQSVVVRFDAVRIAADGAVTTRRFEARQPGVAAEVRAVGAALNVAANTVAADIATWMAEG